MPLWKENRRWRWSHLTLTWQRILEMRHGIMCNKIQSPKKTNVLLLIYECYLFPLQMSLSKRSLVCTDKVVTLLVLCLTCFSLCSEAEAQSVRTAEKLMSALKLSGFTSVTEVREWYMILVQISSLHLHLYTLCTRGGVARTKPQCTGKNKRIVIL